MTRFTSVRRQSWGRKAFYTLSALSHPSLGEKVVCEHNKASYAEENLHRQAREEAGLRGVLDQTGGDRGRIQGEGGPGGRGLGLPPSEASVLMPSLGNRTPAVVPHLLGRSDLLCH